MAEMTAADVAKRNDAIRKLLPFSCPEDRVFMTRGIDALGPTLIAEALGIVANFSEFTEDNDPYGEHDFGSFTLSDGSKCFWKIDDYQGHDGIRCVLTILLAEEY